jgi:hypothetical protein
VPRKEITFSPRTRGQRKTYPRLSNGVVIDGLKRSVAQLYNEEYGIIQNNVNERAVSHTIAHFLRDLFPEYDVDAEYDRNEAGFKEFRYRGRLRRFRPDIVIHKRGSRYPTDLLVVEMKLSGRGSNEDRRRDMSKLTYLVRNETQPEDFRYQVAAFLDLGLDSYILQYIRRDNRQEEFVEP